MANGQTPHKTVGKKTTKKSKNSSDKAKEIYCILCRRTYLKHEAQEHIHGMLHHRELETVLGKDSFHECHACKVTAMGLNVYAQHISTPQHKAKLKSLMSKNVKPLSLCKTLSPETIAQILERNKTLKKEEKKATRKKKKKLKQVAGQKRVEMLQRTNRTDTVASGQASMSTQMQRYHQNRNCTAVVQNKENKVFSVQRQLHQRGTTLENQSGRLALSREPAARTWNQPHICDQFTHSTNQWRHDNNFFMNNQHVKLESSQKDRVIGRPHNTQEGPIKTSEQTAWSASTQYDYYNRQYDKEFTSDHLPQVGAIVFDTDDSTGTSQPGKEGSCCSTNPSTNRSVNAAPIRDVDVSAMLKHIRRALGVREPCRADREAKRRSNEAGVQVAGTEKEQSASTIVTSVQSPLDNIAAPAACSGGSCNASDQPKQTTFQMAPETTQHCSINSEAANQLSNSRESQGSLSQCSDTSLSSEPNMNVTRKVRIAHKPGKAQGVKEAIHKSTQNKLLTRLSGSKGTSSRREACKDMKRKKQDSVKSLPRFGIELPNLHSERERSAQPQNNDLPLSEGFHWESFPDCPSGPHLNFPPSTQGPIECHTEIQLDSQLQEPLLRPQQGENSRTVAAASVKVEQNQEDDTGCWRNNISVGKRKRSMDDSMFDKEPSGKKKTAKSNKDQDQMDQLLAVSLKEDELSHSLQDLDKSLIQARNALQAAYTEVQRLLLLKQQFTAEINSMRTKRIEILQGMQEGYSGVNNVAEKATTSSAGAVSVQRLSPLPSSSANSQSAATVLASPCVTQPYLTPLSTVSIKQEILQQDTAGQTSQCTKIALSNTDAPQVPLNHPVPLFPSNLLPPPLLGPSHAAANASTSDSPETSARQQETREALKDCVEAMKSQNGAHLHESDSEEEMRKNVKEAVKESAAEKSFLNADKNASTAAPENDNGNESDDSVKMMEPSNLIVIDVDESDNEEDSHAASNVPVHSEPPQISVEFCSANTQTSQQNEDDGKVQLSSVKDASSSAECVEDEEPSVGEFLNHTGPVHGLQIHDGLLYTCSGDNTARAYSLANREYQAVFEGHTNKVNCLLVSSLPNIPPRLYTGSSDQTIRCYSMKTKKCRDQLSLPDRVLCLHIAWNVLYAGLANGSVASYDLKTLKQLDVFECHGPRGVSCLATAQEGARRVLLVGSYDSTISVRDAKSGLLLRSLEGHTKTVLCMKVVNDLVFSGSSDTSVHAHNIHTGELIRIYKGHGHAVTSIVILGKVMVTACLDKLVRVYELQSHDRLQVYGGHSDMVMCMAIHKSVIYTGCYDGTIQAVKLNLMNNYRCWWQNCSLIFGIADHLVQHLVNDHSSPNLQTVLCRWRGCNNFFATQQSVRQEVPEHMQSHVDNDSKVLPS